MAEQREDIVLSVKIDEGDATQSIDSLRKELKELNKERNSTNLLSEEGQRAVQALNKRIDENTAKIKTNVSALEKQRLNIGNYKNDIKAAAGELNIFGTNIGALGTKLTSLANPVTAAVAGIGALAAVYGKSTVGAKDLTFASNQLSAAFGLLGNNIASVISSSEDGAGFFSGFVDDILFAFSPKIAAASGKIAMLLEQLEDLQREQISITTQNNERLERNQELLAEVQDSQFSYNDKLKRTAEIVKNVETNQKALTRVLSQQLILLQDEFALDPANERLEEAVKLKERELSLVDRDAAKRISMITKLESNLLDVERKRLSVLKERRDKQEDLNIQESIARLKAEQRGGISGISDLSSDGLSGGLLDTDKIILDSKRMMADGMIQINAELKSDQEKYSNFYIVSKQQELEATKQLLIATSGIFEEGSALQKTFALSSIAIDTAQAIAKGVSASQNIPYPGNLIATLTTVATVLANVASAKQILSQAAGGGDFVTKGPSLLMVGDNPGGRERVTVEPLSGRGKTRLAKGGNLVAMAGGGTITTGDGNTVTNSLTSGSQQTMAMMNAFRNMPAPVVSVKEVTKAQRRIQVKENISTLSR